MDGLDRRTIIAETEAKHTFAAWLASICAGGIPIVGILRGFAMITTAQLLVLYVCFMVAFSAWFLQRRKVAYRRAEHDLRNAERPAEGIEAEKKRQATKKDKDQFLEALRGDYTEAELAADPWLRQQREAHAKKNEK